VKERYHSLPTRVSEQNHRFGKYSKEEARQQIELGRQRIEGHRARLRRDLDPAPPGGPPDHVFAEALGQLLVPVVVAVSGWVVAEVRSYKHANILLHEAYRAGNRYLRSGSYKESLEQFMRTRLGWRSEPTPDHAAALWEVLAGRSHGTLLAKMGASGDPKRWLATEVAYRVRRIRAERDKPDNFRSKVLSPDQEQKLRGAGHRGNPDEGIDPGIIVARSYGFERQAIDVVALTGRPVSAQRAQIVRKCLELELDNRECQRLLGDDGWRSVKRVLIAERERLRKRSSESVRFCPRIDVPR
jgi:hypothetical protein